MKNTRQRLLGFRKLFNAHIMLYFSDLAKAVYLQTDASDCALGSILYHGDEDGDDGSRTLKGAEIAYYTTKKKLLALVWSLKKF